RLHRGTGGSTGVGTVDSWSPCAAPGGPPSATDPAQIRRAPNPRHPRGARSPQHHAGARRRHDRPRRRRARRRARARGPARWVVLTVTAADATAPGYVTVWPTGLVRPVASNLNVTFAGQNIPNAVIVPLGAGGQVSLY